VSDMHSLNGSNPMHFSPVLHFALSNLKLDQETAGCYSACLWRSFRWTT
jgi:hypothetical protein